jgi:hypothetical protein
VEGVEVIAGEEGLAFAGPGGSGREVIVRDAGAGGGGEGSAAGLQAEAVVGPAGDQPLDVAGNGFDVFDVLLGRVGVVKTEVADPAVFAGDAKV